MKKTISMFIILLTIGCIKKTDTITISSDKTKKSEFVDTLEVFIDSINFGRKKTNKIEVYKIGTEENVIAKVYLFKKSKNYWQINDSVILNAVRINNLETRVEDFNNDKLNDIIFTTGMAARGGNNIQSLIIYSQTDKSLKLIKNSENYPNLMYNDKLNCIDSCILTGGQTTYFLRIKNDSLIEFANVDQRDRRIIAEILDTNGKWKEIGNIKDEPGSFDRFIDFNPIEKRKE
ncbi:hypothetical protein [Flavobacterium covae]|uniref:hypothetical protein n=1 Tax=Flavobacterium covae TaxID=2906076 RepID=UPI0035E4424F